MELTQDFDTDFDKLVAPLQPSYTGKPHAIMRFADAEHGPCSGKPVRSRDGWGYDGADTPIALELRRCLELDLPGLYIGITSPLDYKVCYDFYMTKVKAPLSRLTSTNIFVNANYPRFRQLNVDHCYKLGPYPDADYSFPADAMRNPTFPWEPIVDVLLAVERPILLAAGPIACILVANYWERQLPEKLQTILDVGSALDPFFGKRSRPFQTDGHREQSRKSLWHE